MTFLKDVSKLADGLSLVAKEAVRRQRLADGGGNPLQSLIKKTLLSATDLTGLTKGKVQRFDKEIDTNLAHSNKESVVYFTDEIPSSSSSSSTFTSEPEVVSSIERDSAPNEVPAAAEFHERVESPPFQAAATSYEGDLLSSQKDSISSESNAAAEGEPLSSQKDSISFKSNAAEAVGPIPPQPHIKRRKPRERKVPSTSFSRALGFAGLGAGLAWGTLQESAKRLVFGTPDLQGKQSALSPYLSEQNAERLALALCRMRGAALKLGQMLSIQDESVVPAPILAALDIVRQGADVMPRSQLNQVLSSELGHDWSSKLKSFDYEPMAAASIGQVHRAVTKDGMEVAMKIQYPGVADSIESDIDNVKLLLSYTNLIPEKLYLDNAMKVAKEELSRECNYELEAKNQKRFGILLSGKKGFYVPVVIDELSSKRVLTSELVPGIPIDKVALLDQETRNYVGRKLLELTLMELFVFRFMQTDPNWSNFLYDGPGKVINLIDFGAARDYPKGFVDDYLRMVLACANNDREAVIQLSKRLGFLTGEEPEIMIETHVQAGFVVGLPFSKHGGYDFRANNITQSISNLGATMLRHRLTPPPEEAYSLHRKLSGAFLACMKLGAVVPCRDLLLEVYEKYEFGDYGSENLASG